MYFQAKFYRLEGHAPVECDLPEWAMWFEQCDRCVARDEVWGVEVSTVFLGLSHQFGDGPPLIFETMIFGGPDDQEYQERYSTWEEAVAGHARAVALSQPLLRPWRYWVNLPNRSFWLRIAIQRAARVAYCKFQHFRRDCLRRLRR